MSADSGFNLPPGCFEHHLPGNRPQDILREQAEQEVEADFDELCAERNEQCMDCTITTIGDHNTIIPKNGCDITKCEHYERMVERQMEVIKDRNIDFGEY